MCRAILPDQAHAERQFWRGGAHHLRTLGSMPAASNGVVCGEGVWEGAMPDSLKVACVVIVCLGALLFAQPGGAQTTRTLVVTPDSDLVSGDIVTLEGSGFSSGGPVGVCELVIDADPGREDCGYVASAGSADSNGEFSAQFVIRRYLNTPSAGFVDCAAPSATCGMAASEIDSNLNPIPGTVVVVPINLREFAATGRPDIIIKNRKTGAFFGDNFYTLICCEQYREHSVEVGGKWSYALRVQNDDIVADDLIVTATPNSRIRYFVGYFDITAQVTSGGFRYTDVSPGEIRPLAMQMSAVGVNPGDTYAVPVTVASGAARVERLDVAWLALKAIEPSAT
jgi:hypothetical protein